MNNQFVADGFHRWAEGRAARNREPVDGKRDEGGRSRGTIRQLWRWLTRGLRSSPHHNEKEHREKSSPKILW